MAPLSCSADPRVSRSTGNLTESPPSPSSPYRVSLPCKRRVRMARILPAPNQNFLQVLLETYAVNDQMNQLILEHLDPRAWRSTMPNTPRTRTIAAIFTHMHNIRRKWLRLSAPHLKLPAQLNRS